MIAGRLMIVGWVMVALMAFAGRPDAEEKRLPEEKRVKQLEQKAETITMELQKSKTALDAIADEERQVIDEFDGLERKLSLARSQMRTTRSALENIENKIDQIQGQYADVEKQVQLQENYASLRLAALYKLTLLGRIDFLASATSFFDFIQRRSALEQILGEDKAILAELRRSQLAMTGLLEQLKASKTEHSALELALRRKAAELETQQEQRRQLLGRIRGEKTLEAAAYQSLESAARQLDAALQSVAPLSPVPEAQTKAVKIGEHSFETYKGLLSWPVRGKIVTFFGRQQNGKFKVPTFQSGINIQAERGEPIRAVAEGYTIFSNWFNGFGNMIIIDHGQHYYTVYAHLEETFKVKGDGVEKGEVIATVGDSGAMHGPALHFEVRHHGTPTDPLQWIKNG